MYRVSVFNTVPHVEVYSHVSADSVFCCLLETHPITPFRQGMDFLKDLLWATHSFSPNLLKSQNPPIALMSNVHQVLISLKEQNNIEEIGFVTGVMMRPNNIQIGWIGDMRTHLIQNGHLLEKTRLHNYFEDPANELIKQSLETAPKEYCSVVTRGLGPLDSKPPETAIWNVSGRHSLVICTSQIHQYHEPDKYIPQVINWLNLSTRPDDFSFQGAAIKVDYID